MPSVINSDDGVVSGTSGLKTTGGNDGILSIQNNGTTNVTVTAAGNAGFGTSSPVTLKSARTLQVLGNAKLGDANDRGLLSLGDTGSTGANCGIWRGAAGAYGSAGNYLSLGGYDGITFTTGNADIASQTERMRIDSSGRVTTPFQPAFHATRDAAFNAVSGVIVFDSVITNIGSNYNSSTGRFTAPIAGTYIFLVSFFTNIANAPIDFRININGSNVGGNATTGTTTVTRDCHAYVIRTLSASDYVTVEAAGFGTNIPGSLGLFQTFSGCLLG